MKNIFIRLVFAAAIIWWVYLFFTTEIVVVFDSVGYEDLGKMIANQGWGEFLRHGPQREPMFPGLIALSMQLGNWWGVSYYYPLKMIGILFLFLTMIFSYRLMTMLTIRPFIVALTILYMGISPVMTNSSMRLWSEFAAYPWVVLAVIWTIKSWQYLNGVSDDRRTNIKLIGHALMLAVMFLLIMSVKAVAEGVLIFYLWPFYWRVFSYWRAKNFTKARQVAGFCLAVLLVFEGGVCAYKALNYHYNGHFVFTTRGDWALYGNTERRMEPLTPRRLGAAVAYVPGMGICEAIFTQDECDFWSARHSDDIIGQKQAELNAQGITGDAASRYFILSSAKMILSNPLQAMLLMFVEAHKMFFWESSIAFVTYPDWLENIVYSPWCTVVLKAVVAFFSWIACVFAFCFLFCNPGKPSLIDDQQQQTILWIFNFIFWFTAMYALFFILDRYAFPLISLYMVLIAFMLDKISRFRIR